MRSDNETLDPTGTNYPLEATRLNRPVVQDEAAERDTRLRRLHLQIAELRGALVLARTKSIALATIETRRRLSREERQWARDARWECKRVTTELKRLRESFERLRVKSLLDGATGKYEVAYKEEGGWRAGGGTQATQVRAGVTGMSYSESTHASGSRTVKLDPTPSLLSTLIVPPSCSTISRAVARPMPKPG